MTYQGLCANIHGHHGIVLIRVSANRLNSLGIVVDFSDLQKEMKRWIDDKLDHACLLQEEDSEVIAFFLRMQFKIYVTDSSPTAENIAKEICDSLQCPEGCWVDPVRIWESPSQFAGYVPL
jgi:6-pyruvoyltetrahydropterin/6-carboxytetrahydropterin synthase